MQYNKRRKRIDVFDIISLVLIVAAVTIFTTIGVISYRDINGIGGSDEVVRIRVEAGDSAKTIAKTLEDNGIIVNANLFRLFAAVKYTDAGFQYGRFDVRANMTYEEIVLSLRNPYIPETFSIMIPDGATALKIGLLFEEKGLFTAEEFLAACNEKYDFSFYDEIVDSDLKFCKLDGYLFPDTYEFYVDATPQDVIEKLLGNFEKRVLTDENEQLIEESGYSLEEILIIASIVQKETSGSANEAENIASVFLNRLKPGSSYPRLESNASTGKFSNGGFVTGVLYYYYGSEEAVPEGMEYAYDTYERPGLIEGPICSPNKAIIEAVLNHAETDYLFFFHDSNGTPRFSTTYSEHLNKINKYGIKS